MATHSSILAWRIPWTEDLGGYSPHGRKESDMTERLHSLTQDRISLPMLPVAANSEQKSTSLNPLQNHLT